MVEYTLYAGIASCVIALIPLFYRALKVEIHFTAFHTGTWNLFILGGVGIMILLFPYNSQTPVISFDTVDIPFWLVLVPYSLIIYVTGRKWNGNIIRHLGSSRMAFSLVTATLGAQFFGLSDPYILGGIIASSYIGLYIAMWADRQKIFAH